MHRKYRRIAGNVCGNNILRFFEKKFVDLMFAVHFMNEKKFFNISLDIGSTVQVVNGYTLIIVKNVIFDCPSLLSASKIPAFLNPLMTISGF